VLSKVLFAEGSWKGGRVFHMAEIQLQEEANAVIRQTISADGIIPVAALQ